MDSLVYRHNEILIHSVPYQEYIILLFLQISGIRCFLQIRSIYKDDEGGAMPRRKIDLSTPEKGNILEMKTGKPAEKSILPVICERIRYYRETRKLEQKALAKQIGVTANTISNWENGRSRPDINLLPGICEALHISLYDLFNLNDPAEKYTGRQQQLIARYEHLNDGHRYAVDQLILALNQAESVENCPDILKLTYYEKRLAAGIGDPTELDEKGSDIYLYTSPEAARADYVFTVNGNSMEPDYRNGDLVLVQKVSSIEDIRYGDIGAFMIANETYIKEYQKDGLHSLNPDYATMKFSDADAVYLIGRVLCAVDPKFIASAADIERYETIHENRIGS